MIRRTLTAAALSAILGIGSVASARPAVAQEPVREPLMGICLRPLLGKILNLPLIDVPDQPIPKEPIELMLGGNDPKCRP